jgi:short-subunit dehydrogenase
MAKKKARPGAQSSVLEWHDRPVALVTGASSGIGREFSLILAHQGFDLVVVGRDRKRLSLLSAAVRELHGRQALVLALDLADPKSPQKIFRECQRRSIVPEILVNNAGAALYGPFARAGLDENVGLIYLNVMTPVSLTRLFLPSMLERGRGYVLLVASTAGFQPGPFMANYYATKSYLIAFGVALAKETKGSGVSVSVLCPGPTETEFHRRAGIRHTRAAAMAFLPARKVAERAYREMLQHKTIIIPGLLNKIGSAGSRHLPLSVSAEIVKHLHR